LATPQRLTAGETAARLGVKPETLYAYVSRGLLTRQRSRDGSSFDPIEVEQFAAARRRTGSDRTPVLIKKGRPSGGPLMTIDTDVALIEDDQLYYRGRSATALAREADFAAVCHGIWTGRSAVLGAEPDEVDAAFQPLPGAVDSVRRVLATLPGSALPTDRIRVALPVIAAVDPLRDALEPESVIRRSAAMISTIAEALVHGDQNRADDHDHRIAMLLTSALAPEPARSAGIGPEVIRPEVINCVNAALVLLLDHDLAASTLAARAAASARANPYAVVISGLGALDSALHGNASRLAYPMLAAVRDGVPARIAIARTIASGRTGVPGFRHRIYRAADPRAELIFDLLSGVPAAQPVLAAVDQVVEIVAAHGATFRNVDLALAALTLAAGMPADAGEAIFAVARIGGWIAHALDEYSREPLRLRPVGRYVGP
jgi:citrate synthase